MIILNNFCKLINHKLLHNFTYSRLKNYIQLYSTTNYKINLSINNVPLNNYLIKLQKEYQQLENNFRKLKLEPIINTLQTRDEILINLMNLKELLQDNDESLKKLAEEEKKVYETKLKIIDDNLLQALLSVNDEEDCSGMILEVSAGVGGQEAMLFAKELFQMYCNFAEYKSWDYEIADYSISDMGGLRFGSVLINGPLVFQYFKHEAGVHRVQRIPSTEKSGRIHTSTVAVNALPQPNDIQINIQSKDLKIETKKASGAGGQHVNTTDSAVRIVHIPTGVAVECQVDRSQHRNKTIALTKLRALLYQKQLDEHISEVETTRKSQVKTNFRNEKIRTYNFSQDRITDHRLHGVNVHNLKVFMEGNASLEELINKLHEQNRKECLLNIVKNIDDN